MSCSPFIPSVFPHRPPIKLLLISLSVFFSPCMFHSLSTLSGADSRRGTRDLEGGSTDKTRVVNSTRRKPTHLSLSTARLPANLGSSWNSFDDSFLLSRFFFLFCYDRFFFKFSLIYLFIYKFLIQCLLDRLFFHFYLSNFFYTLLPNTYKFCISNISIELNIIQYLKIYFRNHKRYLKIFFFVQPSILNYDIN